MRTSVRTLLAVVLIVAGGAWCFAAEQIDNPQYTSWAKFKAGTTVTVKTESDMGGNKSEMESTTTLLEITAEKAVVETKMSMVAAGQKMDMPASKVDVPAKMDKPAAVAPADAATAAKPEVKESADEVEVSGKKLKCKVFESKSSANGMTTVAKTWTSEDVPGGLVKMESTMDGAMKGTTKMAITSMTIK